jgi:hypothetical protein
MRDTCAYLSLQSRRSGVSGGDQASSIFNKRRMSMHAAEWQGAAMAPTQQAPLLLCRCLPPADVLHRVFCRGMDAQKSQVDKPIVRNSYIEVEGRRMQW